MVKARCEHCDAAGREALREITPTGERQGLGSSEWWTIVLHADGKGGLCPGSGRRV